MIWAGDEVGWGEGYGAHGARDCAVEDVDVNVLFWMDKGKRRIWGAVLCIWSKAVTT